MQLDGAIVPVTITITISVASAALAGMLMVEVYGLKEIAASGEASAVATVVSRSLPQKGKRVPQEMVVKVERVFGTVSTSPRFQVGAAVTVKLAVLDVEWNDPGESPIDARLRGSLGSAEPGARVLVVPSRKGDVELLAGTPENIAKAAILYDDGGARAQWLASPDTSVFASALADEDLAHLAAAELKRRGALTTAHVVRGAERFAFDHYRSLEHDERRRFLEGGLDDAKRDPLVRERLFRMATLEPCASTIAPLAPLLASLDRDDKTLKNKWSDARTALLIVSKDRGGRCPKDAKPDLSPFVPFLAELWHKRPDHMRAGDDSFTLLTTHLDGAARARLATLLLTSARGDDGKLDPFLIRGASELAATAPSADLVAPLEKLAPMRGAKKVADPTALLSIGAAVVEKFPGERARVQAALQPYLDMKAPADAAVLERYRRIVGELLPGAPVATSFELGAGDMKRLADGAQVSLRHEGGELVLWFNHAKHSRSLLREVDVDGYHEWWVEPYVLTVDGPKDRVKITLTPHAQMPEQASHAEIVTLARDAALRAKCPDAGLDALDYKAWLGRGVYTPSAKCKVVVGAFTKTVRLR